MKHVVYIVIILFNLQLMAQKKFNLIVFNKTNALCEKGSARIVIKDTVENYTVLWSNGNANFIAQNLNSGDYSVKITWRQKLDTVIYFTIDQEECPIYFSSLVTPNNDGFNDYFEISNVVYYPNFSLYVYNRWGQQVHKQESSYTPWDGTSIGTHLPDGAYYYVFFYDKSNKENFARGVITLLR